MTVRGLKHHFGYSQFHKSFPNLNLDILSQFQKKHLSMIKLRNIYLIDEGLGKSQFL